MLQEWQSAIEDQDFVKSVLQCLPGVDSHDPKILDRLRKLRIRVGAPFSFGEDQNSFLAQETSLIQQLVFVSLWQQFSAESDAGCQVRFC